MGDTNQGDHVEGDKVETTGGPVAEAKPQGDELEEGERIEGEDLQEGDALQDGEPEQLND